MKVEFLHTLCAVIRRGTFAAAAEDVHVTPGAVSQHIKYLEQHFGQLLFDRSSRRAHPTPFALELAETVQGTLDALESLRTRDETDVSGRTRLGTIDTVQATLLPGALKWLRDQYPKLDVELARGRSDHLLGELNAGTLDAAVVVRPLTGGSSRLFWQVLREEKMVLVAPPDATGKTVQELLQQHDWIRFDKTSTGGMIAAQFVERLQPRMRARIDLLSSHAIVAMVSAGLGVSVIPQPYEPLRRAYAFREVDLGKKGPTRQVAFVCRQADKDKRSIGALQEAFRL
ncbi:LysR family transcriptional regulator [Pigmentiphaga litoralis]|jgi:DNA-binding transcriptional LysR family regulator|uniref:DNA-binding transcriptional LysR family regulator n=1 Tax=Pigmentiphaga litoralis TaxID=516702 RepID=A0A7Y9ISI2_9BURK|nr:LysR family transcriptional regulator [Pigmentiphaga litoralis]NYE24812.1 DNA-binding transcriptional LysR family regulator [Pigmentiphaga litoralis]NYE81574.1 DNA-binding transcriptional LysR family regulator [Pigmentiphaga litoralis]